MSVNSAVVMIFLPLVMAPVIYLFGRAVEKTRPEWITTAVNSAALLVMAVMWIPYVLTVRQFAANGPIELVYGEVSLIVDGVSLLLAAVALALGTLVVLYSKAHMSGKLGDEKYYSSVIAMTGMIIGLGCANDLFNLWVWFEGMAVSSYLLVVFYRDRPSALEAGVKYLVQSAIGSVTVLIGIALVFAHTGEVGFEALAAANLATPVLLGVGALFTIGFGVKIALVPMHTWLPDAHAQAPSGISALLSGVVIEAGLIALLRVLGVLSGDVMPSWGVLLMTLAAVNMLLGNLMALRQKQVKRLLAYSSLSHVGYMLLGIGIAIYAGQPGGAQGGLFHLVSHGMMKGLAFLAAGALIYAASGASQDTSQDHGLTLSDLDGAARRYPFTALALSIAALGLGGLPPLVGFMSKWQIFVAGFEAQNVAVAALVVFAALNSVLSLAYYAPMVNAVYRRQPSAAITGGVDLPVSMQIPMAVLTFAVIAVGFWPRLVYWLIVPAGSALSAAFGG